MKGKHDLWDHNKEMREREEHWAKVGALQKELDRLECKNSDQSGNQDRAETELMSCWIAKEGAIKAELVEERVRVSWTDRVASGDGSRANLNLPPSNLG